MKKVYQTNFARDTENSFQACLASMLGLELDKIPKYNETLKDKQLAETSKWLSRTYGLSICTVQIQSISEGAPRFCAPPGTT